MVMEKRKQIIYLVIMIVIMGMGFSEWGYFVVSAQNNLAEPPQILFESRFVLWDIDEKMLDSNFTIHIIYIENISTNSSYYIKINNDIRTGEFNNTHSEHYLINDTTILDFQVIINNISIMNYNNIIIQSGVKRNNIAPDYEPFTINLSPFEWSKMEWNIFYAIISCAMFSTFISYKLVKRVRKKHGVRTIK